MDDDLDAIRLTPLRLRFDRSRPRRREGVLDRVGHKLRHDDPKRNSGVGLDEDAFLNDGLSVPGRPGERQGPLRPGGMRSELLCFTSFKSLRSWSRQSKVPRCRRGGMRCHVARGPGEAGPHSLEDMQFEYGRTPIDYGLGAGEERVVSRPPHVIRQPLVILIWHEGDSFDCRLPHGQEEAVTLL